MTLYESENFVIVAPEKPHISRHDGGHLVIAPKIAVSSRTQLSPALAIELMKLTMVAGEAMETILIKNGVDIGRINYQDNGNWKPELHIHLYGRAKSAVIQKYGTPVSFPPTAAEFEAEMGNLEPLTETDCQELQAEILRLLTTEKYQSF